MNLHKILIKIKTLRLSPHRRYTDLTLRPGELSRAQLRQAVIEVVG